jgi:hypothetical protein
MRDPLRLRAKDAVSIWSCKEAFCVKPWEHNHVAPAIHKFMWDGALYRPLRRLTLQQFEWEFEQPWEDPTRRV